MAQFSADRKFLSADKSHRTTFSSPRALRKQQSPRSTVRRPKHVPTSLPDWTDAAQVVVHPATAKELADLIPSDVLHTMASKAQISQEAVQHLLLTMHGAFQGSAVDASGIISDAYQAAAAPHHAVAAVADAVNHPATTHAISEVLTAAPAPEPQLLHSIADVDVAHSHLSAAATDALSALKHAIAAGQPLVDSLPMGSESVQMVNSLASWAVDRLAVVQTIDPAAFDTLASSLTQMVDSVHQTVATAATAQSQQLASGLMLSLHQMATLLNLPTAAGTSISAMAAAQEAVAAGVVGEGAAVDGVMTLSLAVLAMVIASLPKNNANAGSLASNEVDEIPLRYDPEALSAYFARHPLQVMQRNAVVVSQLSGFVASILADWRMGKWEANMPQRAMEARKIAEGLGPAYIKIAQALSTRSDIIPEPYMKELQRLQDNVPTFSTSQARTVLEDGLGRPVDAVFEWLSQEPLAAASLGQVYKGKLKPAFGGEEVAVKIQRPGVLESVSLDIFIMRRAALIFSKLPNMNDQWALVLDEWATRFYQEMDYQLEAYNTMTFKRQMASLEGIIIADVYPELTSRKAMVMSWVQGEKLAASRPEDVRAMCSTLLNCYLIQLLETGMLHADPHPGNLLRTPDGKIVILDFGLMTEVTAEQRVALVEYIAHLTMEDWDAVSHDLVTLGFLPHGMPPGGVKVLAPVMKNIMGQLVSGGGLGNLNIMGVTDELEEIARSFKMVVPPYFALVLRAFATIEGIALTVDPQYAIVQECMPYLSRRLLSDNGNPRMREALHQLLYGGGTRLDLARLSKMMQAFGAFTTGASQGAACGPNISDAFAERVKGRPPQYDTQVGGFLANGGVADAAKAPLINDAMKEALKVVFSRDGSYAQELVVDELVAAVDAMSRDAIGEALRMVVASSGAMSALRTVEAFGPLRSMFLPFQMPSDFLSSMAPAVALTDDDRQALNTIRTVIALLQPAGGRMPDLGSSSRRAMSTATELMPLMPELLPGMQSTLELFMRQLVRRLALRLAEDLEPSRSRLSAQKQHQAPATPPQQQYNAPREGAYSQWPRYS